MNGKKARKLRHKAESLTVGKPKVAYEEDIEGTTHLTPTCTKGVYRQLKKAYLKKKRNPRG